MKQFFKKELCCGCGACADICPVGAIRMAQDEEGFLYPVTEKERCTDCGRCEAVCPMQHEAFMDRNPQYFGVMAKKKAVRYTSTSGGVFPVLAEYVLGLQGVVYGAGYDRNMHVIHQPVTELRQLDRIKRTKYVQSKMDGIYRSIEKYLMQGRWVLFAGTPCQAEALRLFLRKTYDRLIVADLVCYGTASPGIWGKYVKYLEHRYKGKMKTFLFRDKRNRDYGHTCSYVIGDVECAGPSGKDVYCGLYFRNCTIRPSCYTCRFCTVERSSDFTIGDFWGIEHINAGMSDGMGTSLMILHTDKAKTIWENIKQEVRWFSCREQDILQPRLLTPVAPGKWRRQFITLYSILPFSLWIKLADCKLRLERYMK